MLTLRTTLDVDKPQVLERLCRQWSACVRSAFNRLIDNPDLKNKEFKNSLKAIHPLNVRYITTAVIEAQSLIDSQKTLNQNPKWAIFGSRKAFAQLQKRHLCEKQRASLKSKFREQRQFNLYSIGDRANKGNVNTRIEGNRLRINVGPHKWIYATIHSKCNKLPLVLASDCYTVRIIRRNNKWYAHFTITEEFPKTIITKSNGVIGIDLNASPANITWAEVAPNGNLKDCGIIPTPVLYDARADKRSYYVWKHAHEITDLALKQNKAIVIENLKNLRGLNRATSNFCRRKLIEAITACAKRKGIEVFKVHPAYTSMIGCVKYAPLYNLSRHTSAALVIARRGLGFKEAMPKAYKSIKASVKEAKQIPERQVDTTKVTRWKKELGTSRTFGRVYKVFRKAALTGHSTGPNWSIFKQLIVGGDHSRIPKLAPLFGSGAKLK